jgi:CBS-domain-containing membrane protein
MKVADVMTHGVDIVSPSATVQEAATKMAELDVGGVLIGGKTEGKNPAHVTVGEVMTPEVVGCAAEDSVEDAFAAMREGQFRRMPVLDREGKLLGIVTLSDLAKKIESPEKLAEAVREIAEPHRSREETPRDGVEPQQPAEDDQARAAAERA